MIIYLPIGVWGADSPSAILRVSGAGVSVNNRPAADSTALYANDLIQTEKNAVARIELTGSSVDISPETIVEYDVDELVLDHGNVAVNTSNGLRVRVGCLVVVPVNGALWTHFQVSDVDGKLTVAAEKRDVYINERSKSKTKDVKESEQSGRSIVRESERKARQDKCGAGYEPAQPPVNGALLNSPWARLGGAGAIGVVTCWALCKSDDPISPKSPE